MNTVKELLYRDLTGEIIEAAYQVHTLNYLRISGVKVGLIINFARPKLEYKRLIV